MNDQSGDILAKMVLRIGLNLFFCATALLAVAHSSSEVAKWGQLFSGLFYGLGFIAGVTLLWRHHWRNGLMLIIGTLAGGSWILHLFLR